MRRTLFLGFTLTLAGMLSLISYRAGSAAPSAEARAYVLAITAGSSLRLAQPERSAAGGPLASAGDQATEARTLSCSGVVRLGVVDVGYSCAKPD
jgi:hypothetical protein